MNKEVLRMDGICCYENGIEIVKDGNISVSEGEIVGLVGRNHAGKSTFLGAATGEFPCRAGDIWIGEKGKKIESIEQARREGIFLIKDESSLIGGFTIKDTMKLNYAFVKNKIRFSAYYRTCREVLELLQVTDPHDTYIRNLHFHKRVLIEIAQALICNARILVFDNVISLLSGTAREEMKGVFELLKSRGVSIVLIEIQEHCITPYLDRLYVMRRGRMAAELFKEELEPDLILALAEGHPITLRREQPTVKGQQQDSPKVLEFRHVRTESGIIRDLNLNLHQNECLGIWNRNRHSGKEILDLLEGTERIIRGEILVNGNTYDNMRANNVSRHKLLIVPEKDELFSNMDVGENISLAALQHNAYADLVMKEGELRYLVQELCSEYMSDDGCRLFPNQIIPDNSLIKKKVMLCRAIAAGAEIIVYNNPWLKLDAWEKVIFNQDILRTHKKGIAQILISSQLDSLYPVCSRILRVEEGRVVEQIENRQANFG